MAIESPTVVRSSRPHPRRTWAIILVAALGTLAVFVGLGLLQDSATAHRDAEVKLGRVQVDLGYLQGIPYRADGTYGQTPQEVSQEMDGVASGIAGGLGELQREAPTPHLVAATETFERNRADLEGIWRVFAALPRLSPAEASIHISENLSVIRDAIASHAALTDELDAAADDYHEAAQTSIRQTRIVAGALLAALLAGFAIFFIRSTRAHAVTKDLAAENERLLAVTRHEADTDALTGLGNRRALVARLDVEMSTATEESPLALAMFDLDGFKYYNDSFGHPAGDALLSRLAARLREAMAGRGTAYRVGGDEFCVLAAAGYEAGSEIAARAAEALSEDGEGFDIGCSYGVAVAPFDATSSGRALGVADQRMYASKESSRTSAGLQSKDVLVQVLNERDSAFGTHLHGVADAAEETAIRLGIADQEVRRIRIAAELHDVGKAAIPDSILNKPGPLTAEEWDFMRTHSAIGERIVGSAPALADSADLVRAVHERIDGDGYPDGIPGEEIPFGARVIAVCDAFDAMTAERPYRSRKLTPDEALAELHRCAGTQFDPAVVAAFVEVLAERERAQVASVAGLTPA